MVGRNRPPQLLHHLGGDGGGRFVIVHRRQWSAWPQPFQQQNPLGRIGSQQANAAPAVIQSQRLDLRQQLRIDDTQFEDDIADVSANGAHGWSHIIVGEVGKRPLDGQRPAFFAGGDEAGQIFQPGHALVAIEFMRSLGEIIGDHLERIKQIAF